jgi:hypothetical protein
MARRMSWTQIQFGTYERWERSDGAVVKWDDNSPYPNPMNPNARMFTAWEPDPSEGFLGMARGRVRTAQDGHRWKPGFPRRWKTAKAAMAAVDRKFPL